MYKLKYRALNNILFGLAIFVLLSCTSNTSKLKIGKDIQVSKECIALNDSAVMVANNLLMHQEVSYIELFDKAIQCDSNYFTAYFNKSNILMEDSLYDEALTTLLLTEKKFLDDGFLADLIAECYYYLDDVEKFNIYKRKAILYTKKSFHNEDNNLNLIRYLSTLKKFQNYKTEELLNIYSKELKHDSLLYIKRYLNNIKVLVQE